MPIPPKPAFGIWWSHYESYSALSIQTEVLAGFANYSLPLNVLQMDVNWHAQNPSNDSYCKAFNGYDWDPSLFPDPVHYVATVQHGNWSQAISPAPTTPLKLILNSHNMLGVDRCSAEYRIVAADAGLDSTAPGPIPFNLSRLATMRSVFKHLLSRDAVGPATTATRPDWWWTDGSLARWDSSTGNGRAVDNLFMSTYLHSSAIRYGADRSGNRPLVMPRFSQRGVHRYCCGFSGDTSSQWETLQSEVNMTKTAANILFGYWSHDIGGFKGTPSAELYARWAQFGAISPLWRSHGSRQDSERRYWLFSSFAEIKEAMVLRVVLSPLLYTLAAEAHRTGVAVVRPMYYGHPTCEDAYADPFEYMIGDNILARPVVDPASAGAAVDVQVWLPPAASGWLEWNSSRHTAAPNGTVVNIAARLQDVPLFVLGGSILPLLPPDTLDVTDTSRTVWAIIAGASKMTGTRYWDDGASTAYERGASAVQSTTCNLQLGELQCFISPLQTAAGFQIPIGPHTHSIELRGFPLPRRVTFNEAPGVISVQQVHTLARPLGTVLLTPPAPVTSLGVGLNISVAW